MCRFHRAWAEDMLPEIVGEALRRQGRISGTIAITASRINSRNSSVFWESERGVDMVHTFLKRKRDVDGLDDEELEQAG